MTDTAGALARSAAARDRAFDLQLRCLLAAATAHTVTKRALRQRLQAATALLLAHEHVDRSRRLVRSSGSGPPRTWRRAP